MEEAIVDRSFMKELKRLDTRLGAKFNYEHIVLTYNRGFGAPVNIHRVKAEDGGFRQPDRRDLEFIKSFDMENESCRGRLQRLSKTAEEIGIKLRVKAKDDIKHMTRENKNQLSKAISNLDTPDHRKIDRTLRA